MNEPQASLPLYFAYGANLDPRQLELWCPGHRVLCRAILHDHAVRFHGFSKTWGGATARIEHAPGQSTHGVVFELSPAGFAALDRGEGCLEPGHPDNLADRVQLPVELENGETIEVFTHLPRPLAPGRPSRAYRWAMLSGMRHHGLPALVIAALETEATAD